MKNRFISAFAAIVLLQIYTAFGEEDDFAALDAQLEAEFLDLDEKLESDYRAIDAAIEAGYQQLRAEVEKVWGSEEAILPSQSSWVDYSEDRTSRRRFDFENGVLLVERIVFEDQSPEQLARLLRNTLKEARKDTEVSLNAKDDVLNYAKSVLAEQNINLDEGVPARNEPVLEGLITVGEEEVQTALSNFSIEKALNGASDIAKKKERSDADSLQVTAEEEMRQSQSAVSFTSKPGNDEGNSELKDLGALPESDRHSGQDADQRAVSEPLEKNENEIDSPKDQGVPSTVAEAQNSATMLNVNELPQYALGQATSSTSIERANDEKSDLEQSFTSSDVSPAPSLLLDQQQGATKRIPEGHDDSKANQGEHQDAMNAERQGATVDGSNDDSVLAVKVNPNEPWIIEQETQSKPLIDDSTKTNREVQGEQSAVANSGALSESISVTSALMSNGSKKIIVAVPFQARFLSENANRYQEQVMRESKKRNLPPSLVYAIMETESHFNPRARSHVPAFGLMQLVPSSGGLDAYHYVYGEKLVLGPDYYFNPNQNVELGAAYLDLLLNRYLRRIEDEESRLYCAIAAYNTGAGNVARSFTGKTSVRLAAQIINELSPKDVFDHLITKLPYQETRNYLKKVSAARERYRDLDMPAV